MKRLILIFVCFLSFNIQAMEKEKPQTVASTHKAISIEINTPEKQNIELTGKNISVDLERNWSDIAQVITAIVSFFAIAASSFVSYKLVKTQNQQQERTLRVSLADNRIAWIEKVRTSMAKLANDFIKYSNSLKDDHELDPDMTSFFEFKMLFNPLEPDHKKLLSTLSESIDFANTKQLKRKILRMELLCQYLTRLEWNQAKLELTYTGKNLKEQIENEKQKTFEKWMNDAAFARAWNGVQEKESAAT
ncbi:hypothetical protein [uncultured Deefgea sp.]|uniref:hypothetical protein n=1 Tax=uncultured Deefgea sp. TaxID=1304914 RepID=UPI0025940237|nr:hypothetical protein [uncultured Deefgea sp.]